MALNTPSHLAPRLRIRGATLLLPLHLFVACYREDFTLLGFLGPSEWHVIIRESYSCKYRLGQAVRFPGGRGSQNF
jgi:hypothetical protein